ncbi:hypothetical protein GCM10010965_27530 [Caldalkalibacillus thermarum]|nr:hypothetical protein GCM10010965_27530 [Caldalkalibacillus thermarum]
MFNFNDRMENNITKDHAGNYYRYRHSCLVLKCKKCWKNENAPNSTAILFEQDIKRLTEGISCPHCDNILLVSESFQKLVQSFFYAPFHLYSERMKIVLEHKDESVSIPVTITDDGAVLDSQELLYTDSLFSLFTDFVSDKTDILEKGIRDFDFTKWDFSICSQNADTLLAEDIVDFLF